jgi:hypothetical protein
MQGDAPSEGTHGLAVRAIDVALQLGVALLAARSFAVVARILLNRWDFPAELEWMEGGSLGHVARIAKGAPFYVKPSPDWVPFLYHPLYYYASWIASWFVGLSLPALRLVSLAGHAATLCALSALTWAATQSAIASFAAPALYTASFEVVGAWFDIARVDSFAQGLFMLGVLAVRRRSLRAQLAAAGLFYLCFMSKQTELVTMAPVVLWALVKRGRPAWIAAGVLASISMISVAVMQLVSKGWYGYYCVDLPRAHSWLSHMWKEFWTSDLRPLWPTLGALLMAAVIVARRRLRYAETGLAMAVLGGGLVTSWFSRLHTGGYLNVLMPCFASAALCSGLAIGHARAASRGAGWVVLAFSAAQLWILRFDPERHEVGERDRRAAEQVRAAIADIAGDVYAPEASSYLIATGKEPRPHAVAIADILRGGGDEPRNKFLAELEAAVASRRFSAVVLADVNINGSTIDVLEAGYALAQSLEGPETRTGVRAHVDRLLLPLPPSSSRE